MKKNVFIILSFFFLFRLFWSVGIAHAGSVVDVYAYKSIYHTVNRALTTPALLRTFTNVAANEKGVSLIINKAGLSSIGGLVISAGIIYGGSALFDYLKSISEPIQYKDGSLVKTVSHTSKPCPSVLGVYCENTSYLGKVETGTDARNAVSAAAQALTAGCAGSGTYCYYDTPAQCQCNTISAGVAECNGGAWGVGKPKSYFNAGYGLNVPDTSITTQSDEPAYPLDVQNALDAGLTLDEVNAIKAAQDAVVSAATVYDTDIPKAAGQTARMSEAPEATKTAIKQIFDAAVDPTEAQAAQDETDAMSSSDYTNEVVTNLNQPLTENQFRNSLEEAGLSKTDIQAAVDAALKANGITAADLAVALNQSGGLTQEQVQTAVKNAIDSAVGTDVAVPIDPTIIMPTKLSLTTVMGSFMTTINALPMMQTLQGLTINCSGTSSLCLNLPANLGGNRCYDASGMQGALNMVGSAFLGLTTIFSFVGIFRS